MSKTLATSIAGLLSELAYENPPPEERWMTRDDFDPMHRMSDLRAAAAKGLIELVVHDPIATSQFRLTPAGRAMVSGETSS